jgi:hypothetical protein
MNNSNKLLLVVVCLTLAMIGGAFGGRILIDKIADRVIQKLQKDYSPSPYGPGIDPDKLDPEKIKFKIDPKNVKPLNKNQVEDWNK